MSKVYFKYVSQNGEVIYYRTKKEAEEAVAEKGGTYEVVYDYIETSFEGHCRIGARLPGKQIGR